MTEKNFEAVLESFKVLIDRYLAGEDISQEIIGSTGKTFAELGIEWDSYISHGSYESPHLYDTICAADPTGTLARSYFALARSYMLHIKNTNKVFSFVFADRIGRYFEETFLNKYNIDNKKYNHVLNANPSPHVPWAELIAPILVAAQKIVILPLTPENANNEKFRQHLRELGPFVSELMHLSPEKENEILAEIKIRYDKQKKSRGF